MPHQNLSLSAPKRKKGRNFIISDMVASAPAGGALAAGGALISGAPFGFGVNSDGKALEEAASTSFEDSEVDWVESGKGGAGKEAATRGAFKDTSSGSEKSASIPCATGGEDGDASSFGFRRGRAQPFHLLFQIAHVYWLPWFRLSRHVTLSRIVCERIIAHWRSKLSKGNRQAQHNRVPGKDAKEE